MEQTKVTLYTRKQCPLCEEAKQLLLAIKEEYSFEIQEIDIYKDDQLLEMYQLKIPVIVINGEEVDDGQVDLTRIISFLKEKTTAK